MHSQNDRVYARKTTKKRDVAPTRLLPVDMFTSLLQQIYDGITSVSVSKLGYTERIFVDPDVKVNGEYIVRCTYQRQVAQLSQRDRAAGWVSYDQKWKTGTGRQYILWTL